MERKIYNLIILFILFFGASSGFSIENAKDVDFAFARKAFDDGFYELAKDRLENLLKNYPQSSRFYEAHNLLGRCYYYQNNLTRALYDFELVLNAPAGGKFQDEALYWSAEIYQKNADYKRALEFYQKVIEDFPSSKYLSYALYSKAWIYYKLGYFEDAIAYFREVAAKYPFEKAAMESSFRIGECEYLLARYEKSEEALMDFIRAFPVSERTHEAYYLKGEAGFYRGRYRDSIADFERALSISPNAEWAPFAIYRIARCYSELGEYARSIKELKRCVAAADNDLLKSLSWLGMARSYEKQGAARPAQDAYDSVLKLYPDSAAAPEAYYRKAEFLYKAGRYKEAENLCLEAVGRFPKGAYAYELRYELGQACLAQDKAEEALKEFIVVEEGSKDMDLRAASMVQIGDIYFDGKEYVKAMDRYDAILNKYPASALVDRAQYQIGNIFLIAQKYDQAILAYRSIIANFPQTGLRRNIIFRLGIAHFRKAEFETAVSEFSSFLESRPEAALLSEARFYLANSLYGMNKYEKALPLFKEIIKESKEDDVRMMARYQLGWCYYNIGKEAEAIGEFESFLRDYPASVLSADAMFWLGERYRSRARYDKAKEYFLRVQREFPLIDISGDASYQLILTLCDEGRLEEAVSKLEEFTVKFSDSALVRTAYRKIAGIEKGKKDFEKAVGFFRKALGDGNPEVNAQVQYEIAECFEEKGDLTKAVEEYMMVPYLYQEGAFWAIRAELKCAMLLERLGRIGEAKELYEKLAGMDVEESEFAREKLASL